MLWKIRKMDPITLTRYALGDVSPEQETTIDKWLLEDESHNRQLNSIISRLICNFELGGLEDEDRERLKRQFSTCPERAQKKKAAELLYSEINGPAITDTKDLIYRHLLGYLPSEQLSNVDFKIRPDHADYGLILLYLRGDLSRGERRRFKKHFLHANSPDYTDRIEKLRFVEVFLDSARRHRVGEFSRSSHFHHLRQWLGKRSIRQPLTTVSVIVFVALVWGLFSYQSPRARGLNMLYAHYAQERPAEARLTGFGYGAYHTRQNMGVVKFYDDERDEAFRLILREVNEEKSAAAYQALGQIYLAYNDPNEAVHRFELALQQNPDDARLRNDFAVALMEREKLRARSPGQSTGEDMALALEHLHRAIELDPSLLDAHFNLALCHQHQTLWRTAEEDWKRYLEKDSGSPWVDEARKNLTKVTEKIKQSGGNRDNI